MVLSQPNVLCSQCSNLLGDDRHDENIDRVIFLFHRILLAVWRSAAEKQKKQTFYSCLKHFIGLDICRLGNSVNLGNISSRRLIFRQYSRDSCQGNICKLPGRFGRIDSHVLPNMQQHAVDAVANLPKRD